MAGVRKRACATAFVLPTRLTWRVSEPDHCQHPRARAAMLAGESEPGAAHRLCARGVEQQLACRGDRDLGVRNLDSGARCERKARRLGKIISVWPDDHRTPDRARFDQVLRTE